MMLGSVACERCDRDLAIVVHSRESPAKRCAVSVALTGEGEETCLPDAAPDASGFVGEDQYRKLAI